jgi:hypothetical protein
MPLLQQWATESAADGEAASIIAVTLGQQLQQAVQLLDQVMVRCTPQQPQLTLPMQQHLIVQAGLVLVELCSLLLGNAAAGAAVAAQLVAHADVYAADAVEWLAGSQSGCVAAGDLLQQLEVAVHLLQGQPAVAW